jgi:hypothetical protein
MYKRKCKDNLDCQFNVGGNCMFEEFTNISIIEDPINCETACNHPSKGIQLTCNNNILGKAFFNRNGINTITEIKNEKIYYRNSNTTRISSVHILSFNFNQKLFNPKEYTTYYAGEYDQAHLIVLREIVTGKDIKEIEL